MTIRKILAWSMLKQNHSIDLATLLILINITIQLVKLILWWYNNDVSKILAQSSRRKLTLFQKAVIFKVVVDNTNNLSEARRIYNLYLKLVYSLSVEEQKEIFNEVISYEE